MSNRFFLESEIHRQTASLDGDQAHHALHVLRYNIGDEIILFDGRGNEYVGRIVQVGKRSIELSIVYSKSHQPENLQITIAVAFPKGDRQKFLIEKLVELGVHRLIPLKTSRTVALANSKVIGRCERAVIESSKQCGRNFLMQVLPQQTVAELLKSVPAEAVRLVADPYTTSRIAGQVSVESKTVAVAIGPEGGFTDSEQLQLANAGWQSVSLGLNILRIETAAIAAAVLLGNLD